MNGENLKWFKQDKLLKKTSQYYNFLKEAGGNYFEYIVIQHEVICMTVQ